MEEKIWIAAIDPGKNNFAFIIEEVDLARVKELTPVKKTKRHASDNTPTVDYMNYLENLFLTGRTVLVRNINLTKNSTNKRKTLLDKQVFINLTNVLDEYSEYWDKCSYILIEQQMSFGRKHNTMAIKIAQHTYSYFIFQYGPYKEVYEFASYHKTQVLGAEKGIDKPARKKWATALAGEIWVLRDDEETQEALSKVKKRDDMSDCLLMTIAFLVLFFVDNKEFD